MFRVGMFSTILAYSLIVPLAREWIKQHGRQLCVLCNRSLWALLINPSAYWIRQDMSNGTWYVSIFHMIFIEVWSDDWTIAETSVVRFQDRIHRTNKSTLILISDSGNVLIRLGPLLWTLSRLGAQIHTNRNYLQAIDGGFEQLFLY